MKLNNRITRVNRQNPSNHKAGSFAKFISQRILDKKLQKRYVGKQNTSVCQSRIKFINYFGNIWEARDISVDKYQKKRHIQVNNLFKWVNNSDYWILTNDGNFLMKIENFKNAKLSYN